MAMSEGITTPYERVFDVATRKTPDPRNRTYFLSEFMNKLLSLMNYPLDEQKRFTALMSEEDLLMKFNLVSDKFYQFYKGEIGMKKAHKDDAFVAFEEI